MSKRTMFEELGAEPGLRQIIDRFVDRNFDDLMIGFFFRNADRERIKAKEYEFAARHLGAEIEYSGRPIEQAHARHPIMGGQFMRRLQILKETLAEFAVPEHIQKHWLEHTQGQRHLITRDATNLCDPKAARERVLSNEPEKP